MEHAVHPNRTLLLSSILIQGASFLSKFQVVVLPMELTAVVQYAGNLAHYTITPESAGIYHARLLKYEHADGADGATPPLSVTLVRGVRHWVGSTEEQHFVDQLGKAIEQRVRRGDPHSI